MYTYSILKTITGAWSSIYFYTKILIQNINQSVASSQNQADLECSTAFNNLCTYLCKTLRRIECWRFSTLLHVFISTFSLSFSTEDLITFTRKAAFLSEPNSITSDWWKRTGKFAGTRYRRPSLLQSYLQGYIMSLICSFYGKYWRIESKKICLVNILTQRARYHVHSSDQSRRRPHLCYKYGRAFPKPAIRGVIQKN